MTKAKTEETVTLTFKTRIYPTKSQVEYFSKAFGIRRWTYNWAVNEFYKNAESDKFPSNFTLQKQLNNTLVLQDDYAWLRDVNSMIRQEALKDMTLAVKAYAKARHEAKRTPEKCDVDKYKPHFQKKGKCVESFRYNSKGEPVKYVSSKHFTLTTVFGSKPLRIRTAESVDFLKDKKFCTCTILRKADKFYVAITYERTNRKKDATRKTVGLDLGIKHVASAFDGNNSWLFDLPDSLRKAEVRRENLQAAFSRCEKNSKRSQKLLTRVERAYVHEANIKKDFREKLTTWLVSNYDTIKIDDYTFASALNLKHSHRTLYRVGIYAFKERLKAKIAEYKKELLIIPRGTPTTQTCSVCGCLPSEKLVLSERTYHCEHCGSVLDRDLNAAVNMFNFII